MYFKQTISDGWTYEAIGHEVSIRDAAGQFWGWRPDGCVLCTTGQRFPVGSPEEMAFTAKRHEGELLLKDKIEQTEKSAHAKLMAPMSEAEREDEREAALTRSMDREDSIH